MIILIIITITIFICFKYNIIIIDNNSNDNNTNNNNINKKKKNHTHSLLGSIRLCRFNSVAESLGSPRLTSKTKGVSPAVSERIEPGNSLQALYHMI